MSNLFVMRGDEDREGAVINVILRVVAGLRTEAMRLDRVGSDFSKTYNEKDIQQSMCSESQEMPNLYFFNCFRINEER